MRRSVLQPFKIDKNARSFELAGHSVQVGARTFDVLAFLDDHGVVAWIRRFLLGIPFPDRLDAPDAA
jgi:hypothetical protein